MSVSDLPTLNAILNASAACLLVAGYLFIRRRNVRSHKMCMVAAFATSALFLASYLLYHYQAGSVAFSGQGWVRPIYFFVLITHIILAALILPLALLTLYRALRRDFVRHVKVARWTLPIWIYVSVTGVTIYLMLYRLNAAS